MEEIRNKIKESGLINLDLAFFKPNKLKIVPFDIAEQLWQGLVLKEKDFRQFLADHDWNQYQNKYVYIFCSTDAIVPTWAFMLVASKLIGIAAHVMVGTEQELIRDVIKSKIEELDIETYKDGRLIIKGCSDIDFPAFAMVKLMERLQPVCKSIMYGEPCSTVPIYKAPKK
ncbi:MAG: DUF2480 family protein [Flavobacteriia bacterium]|nr:DUF2480 family protein [Flavobacteriia bacterium]OJX37541.1 MAG: hypothetical protein BGO87_00845 [Flavobacteriia bacterium 40-80]